jgi:hypothetical protein
MEPLVVLLTPTCSCKQGSSRIGAQFTVGLMGMSFGYFLKLKHEPKYNTFTWTQDYRHSSDFGTFAFRQLGADIIY